MNDIEALAEEIRDALGAKNVRVLDAEFSGDSVAILDGDTVTVEALAEIIAESFTPFATVISSTLEPSELDELLESEGEEVAPEDAQRIMDEHAGETDMVGVYWLHSGARLGYIVVASWRREFESIMGAWKLGQRARYYDEQSREAARITHLADQLEADPAYRAANAQERRIVGTAFVEPLVAGDDYAAGITRAVLELAGRKAREAATAAYLPLREDFYALAEELIETATWRTSNARASERDDAARQFLLNRTDGYAPTSDDVKKLRLAAERRAGRR